jgi:AcrR family transcriptional regulator
MKATTRCDRPRRAAKREHIVGAASRVFASRPYHLVSMDDVAGAARVGKGTLYRYFPSKEELYLGVVAEAFDLLIRRLDRVEAEALPAPTALARMIEAIVETFAAHLPFFRLWQQGEARLLLRKKQVIRARRERIADGLARVLERGAQTGVFRKVDRHMVPTMVIGLVWGTAVNHADESPPEILAQRVVDLCLHGVLQSRAGSP